MNKPKDVPPVPRGVLTREECQALFMRITALCSDGGSTHLSFSSANTGASRWARNRMTVSSDINRYDVGLSRNIRGAGGGASTSRIDVEGLREVIERAENALLFSPESPEADMPPDPDVAPEPFREQPILRPVLWSDSTYAFDVGKRTKLSQEMIAPSENVGLLAAGDLSITAEGPTVLDTGGMARYYLTTEVQCSMTVRDPKGTASGWAGVNHYNLERIDPTAIAARALDKCLKSRNPVAIEPGRYETILEPQAVADLFQSAIDWLDRETAEQGLGPYTNGVDQTKIGEKIMDDRLMLRADPMAKDAEFVPFDRGSGDPYRAVNWIEQGVLKELAYNRGYARGNFGKDDGLLNPGSYMLMPVPGTPTATIEQMTAATERGVLVTRLWDVKVTDSRSLMSSGFTRDGIWLIEKGKIKSAIKNLRFTDSPLFALNGLLQVGAPVRVFKPGRAVMAPPIRVQDFNFSALADAV